MMKLILFGLGAVMGCSSCSNPAVDPLQEAQLVIPDNFGTADGSNQSSATYPDHWWQNFAEPTLNAVIEKALQGNFDLRAATAQLRQAEIQVALASGEKIPSVAAGLRAGRSRQNFFGFPVPGAPDVIPILTSTYGLSLDVSWELDLWGRLDAAEDAAVADFLASSAVVQGARLSLAGQTAKAWFSLIEANQQVDLASQIEQLNQQWLAHLRSRFQSGSAFAGQILVVESTLQQARSNRLARELQSDRLRRSLETLMAHSPAGKFTAATTELPRLSAPIPVGLPADLIARRPDLVEAQARFLASHARTEVARASLYPRLSLSAGGGTSTAALKELLNGDFQVWSLAGNLTAPLFQGGRLRNQVEIQRSGEQADAWKFAQTTLLALAEVEGTLYAEQSLLKQHASLLELQAQQKKIWQDRDRRYLAGTGDLPAWVQARQSFLQAQSQALALQLQTLLNRVDLHLALGGDFAPPSTVDA
jgi:outer membrane protein, multidrug efflux system